MGIRNDHLLPVLVLVRQGRLQELTNRFGIFLLRRLGLSNSGGLILTVRSVCCSNGGVWLIFRLFSLGNPLSPEELIAQGTHGRFMPSYITKSAGGVCAAASSSSGVRGSQFYRARGFSNGAIGHGQHNKLGGGRWSRVLLCVLDGHNCDNRHSSRYV